MKTLLDQIGNNYVPKSIPRIRHNHNFRETKKEFICCETVMIFFPSQNSYICNKCGKMEEYFMDINNDVHNIVDNSSINMYISNNPKYQKKLICQISDYKKVQKKATIEQLFSYVYQYEKNKIPYTVVQAAAEYYYEMQQCHIIKRGSVREGIMASCLYRKCKEFNIIRKPKEIIDIFGISQYELTRGEKILDELHSRGFLPQFNHISEEEKIHAFMSRYLEIFNIPSEDHPFPGRLVYFTTKYVIAENSVISSKCAGAIYILGKKYPNGISREIISEKCDISKSTFLRFYSIIMNVLNTKKYESHTRHRLRKIFKNFNVPFNTK